MYSNKKKIGFFLTISSTCSLYALFHPPEGDTASFLVKRQNNTYH